METLFQVIYFLRSFFPFTIVIANEACVIWSDGKNENPTVVMLDLIKGIKFVGVHFRMARRRCCKRGLWTMVRKTRGFPITANPRNLCPWTNLQVLIIALASWTFISDSHLGSQLAARGGRSAYSSLHRSGNRHLASQCRESRERRGSEKNPGSQRLFFRGNWWASPLPFSFFFHQEESLRG